jgi:hypothetical protein
MKVIRLFTILAQGSLSDTTIFSDLLNQHDSIFSLYLLYILYGLKKKLKPNFIWHFLLSLFFFFFLIQQLHFLEDKNALSIRV